MVLVVPVACNKGSRQSPATGSAVTEAPRNQVLVKQELIASLRADLEKMRSGKDSSVSESYRLAQALDQLMREDESVAAERGHGAWNAEVQVHGSRRSADLATEYLVLQQAVIVQAAKDQEQKVEELLKRLAAVIIEAKSAADLDAPLMEIATLQNKVRATSGIQSPHSQLLLFRQFAAEWQTFLRCKDSGDNANAIQSLERLKSFAQPISSLDPIVVSTAFQNASRSLGIPSKEQLDERISSLVDRALAAAKSTDLDPLLIEINQLGSYGSQLPERGLSRISKVEGFVKRVQGLLFARETNDGAKFRDLLGGFETPLMDGLGVPRSRLLAYAYNMRQSVSSPEAQPLNPAASPAAAAARMVSLESIRSNLPALRVAIDADPGAPFASSWRMDLMILESMARQSDQLKAGRGLGRAVHELGLHTTSDPSIRELQRQFDLLCLNITFSEETQLLPGDKETAKDFTARLKKRLVDLQKWDSLQTLYTAIRALKITEPVLSADDDAAVSGYLYGIRLEQEAKDLRMATCSYQTVLASPSKLVPASLIGSRLEEIRKKDPKAYQQGSALALNISRAEGKRAPGERADALQWIIPPRKPWSGR